MLGLVLVASHGLVAGYGIALVVLVLVTSLGLVLVAGVGQAGRHRMEENSSQLIV